MINVTVMYPNQLGSHFDVSYYCATHIPLTRRLLGSALLNVVVEEGLAGGAPGAPPPYAVLCHLYFASLAAFQDSFMPNAPQLVSDIPNYTNVEPTIQISTVKS